MTSFLNETTKNEITKNETTKNENPENKKDLLRILGGKTFKNIDEVYDLKQELYFNKDWTMKKLSDGEMSDMLLLDSIVGNNLLSSAQVVDFLNLLSKN